MQVAAIGKETEPMRVLDECKEIMVRKSNDYQNPHSRIKQADYYPRGVATLLDIIQAKVLRMYSVIEAMENDPAYVPNFESFEDSCKDLINYSSFAAAYSRGKIDGQDPSKDFLNRTNGSYAKETQPELFDNRDYEYVPLIEPNYVNKIMGYEPAPKKAWLGPNGLYKDLA